MPLKFLLVALAAATVTCSRNSDSAPTPVDPSRADTGFVNPLLPGGPDPWVEQKDTTYYYTHTMSNRVAIMATNKMSELKNAQPVTIWSAPATGPYSKEIWAPEIHFLNNKWFAYFAADDGTNDNHRIYAAECDNADPTKGPWAFKGKIADTAADFWAIDATVFTYKDQLYMAWSGWQGSQNVEQDLFIAKMKDPLTLESPRVMISHPQYDWEKKGTTGGLPAVNEGPEALIHDNKLFITYSASGCWTDDYSLGLLTLKDGGDPLNPGDWSKGDKPVFSSAPDNGAFAPGHNSFFVSRDGKENWLLYHANSAAGQGCTDARNPRMQSFGWNADGTPAFGTPVKINQIIRKPGGE